MSDKKSHNIEISVMRKVQQKALESIGDRLLLAAKSGKVSHKRYYWRKALNNEEFRLRQKLQEQSRLRNECYKDI